MIQTFVLGQTCQWFEDPLIVWIVGVILNFRKWQKLGACRARVTRRLCKVYFCRRLRKGDWIIEGGVTPGGGGHPGEPGGGLEHARLERGEGRAGLDTGRWVGADPGSGGGWGRVFPPAPGLGLVTSKLGLRHEALVVARMEAPRIVVPGIGA